jgi:hypothetical protein
VSGPDAGGPDLVSPDLVSPDLVSPEAAARRATRLLRWYPKGWRSRYGEEFTELLISDIGERPGSWARTADVARGGIVARLASAGLCGCGSEASGQARASLVSLACCVTVFLVFGAALWSQLTIGWQWSEPDTAATVAATVVMSAAMLAFGVLALAAAVPVAWSAVSRIGRGQSCGLIRPSALFLAGTAIMVAGGRHFGNGWPGTGGHPWAAQGLVPGGVAAFSWASTLSVSSYWVHPAALAGFPWAELAWMVLSPLAVAGAAAGAAALIRRTELPPRVLRFEASLGTAACGTMAFFLAGCCLWIAGRDSGPEQLFHVGTIDIAGAVAMAIALLVGRQAVRQAHRNLA